MDTIKHTIIIIGGGAAGIFAAIGAKAQRNMDSRFRGNDKEKDSEKLPLNEVIILEKMPRIGTKLMIAGGGRCNITHDFGDSVVTGRDLSLQEHYPAGAQFLHSSFNKFGAGETLDFFHSIGVETFVDRGGRVFPKNESAPETVKILENHIRRLGVKIILNREAIEIRKTENKFTVKTKDGGIYQADKVIITAGGMSYPKTGSAGGGFNIAKKLGHKVTDLRPSLVPLNVKEPWVKNLQGLTLKNVEAKIMVDEKETAAKFGDMIFTHFGLSGPIILYLSRTVVNLICRDRSRQDTTVKISIDLKPALPPEKLDARLRREFLNSSKKQFKNVIANLLPQKMIPVFMDILKIKPDIQCSQITAGQRQKIINLLKNFEFTITGDRGFYEAEVTQGGVSLNEINPRTMESKICPGLFFAGEVLDIDGYIGGFNLQAAFSTGYIAGQNAALQCI